jgi:uncharacterized protein DUF4334/GXWXG protein
VAGEEVLSREAASKLQALRGRTTLEEALSFFDSLPAVTVDQMMGSWRGSGLETGHPFDGLLESTGWHGKRFLDADQAHPLVYDGPHGLFAVNPRFVPLRAMLRFTKVLRHPAAPRLMKPVMRLLRTSAPQARLRMVEYRGVVTATMCYDRLPVHDHFRRVDADTVVGAMDARGMARPFLFVLHREGTGGRA